MQSNEVVWDAAVPGFGARRQKEVVSYFLKYRTTGRRQRWHTIGRHGAPWTPDTARDEARRLLGDIARGKDPAAEKLAAKDALTVGELCDLYLAAARTGRILIRGGRTKKIRTLSGDSGMIERHVKPLLGRKSVTEVTRSDIEKFMHAVAEGKTAGRVKSGRPRGVSYARGGLGVASRTVGLLGAIFTWAVRKDLRPDNPVRGVQRPADGRRQRRLTDSEYLALGKALREASTQYVWPPAVAAARFLAVTGWRRGEALELHWAEVDLARRTVILADTKTGRSMRPLSYPACDVLRDLPRTGNLVFSPTRGSACMGGFRRLWNRIVRFGNLPPDVTPHVLRHSFASLAADLGYSEPTIAALVGHKGRTITSRYVHSADAVLLAAADAVAIETAARMGEGALGRSVRRCDGRDAELRVSRAGEL